MKEDNEGILLKFWFSQNLAILPIILYVVLSGVIMITCRYYSMKVLIFAALISLFIGFLLCRNKEKYWESIIGGLMQYGNARLLFIFIVIGILSKVLVTGGIGSGFIWISLQLHLNGGAFVVFTFLACALVSMGAGAPIAAVIAVVPIFFPPGVIIGANPEILIGAMLSGVFFGDALSPSSQVTHTTISTQHDAITKESAQLLPTLKERAPYIIVIGLFSLVLFYVFGGSGGKMGDMDVLNSMASAQGLWMLLPIALLLFICFKTSNLFLGVTYAIIFGVILGLVSGVFTFDNIMNINLKTQELHGVFLDGVMGSMDIVVSTLFLYGLIAVAVDGGMVTKCCNYVLSKKFAQQPRGAEILISSCLGIINILLAGCVLPSIIMFGNVADKIGQKGDVPPNRRSMILMGMATNITAIIPINSAFVMGAITLVGEMEQNNVNLPQVSPYAIFFSSYYCILLTIVCILWVVFGVGRKARCKKS